MKKSLLYRMFFNRYKFQYMNFWVDMALLLHPKKINLIGCSEREVADVGNKLCFELPAAYREFLLLIGKTPEDLIYGDVCSYDDIIFNQNEGREIYYNATNKELQPSYFIF
jgi:hypothetical protein